MNTPPVIGILGLQGATQAHRRALTRLGVSSIDVKSPSQLDGIDGLIIPGGESTTISMLAESSGLFEPIAALLADGLPVLGTCAGMILLASNVLDGREDQRRFEAIDISVRRNGFGRQIDSFETDIDISGLSPQPFPAVFIRAPMVEAHGPDVEVLASVDGRPVLCRHGAVLACAFHPELSDDDRVHELFLAGLGVSGARCPSDAPRASAGAKPR